MPRQRVGDIEIYYEVHGTGPRTLVLIRGLGSNLLAWYEQIDEFARHYKCIVFDNRGAGRTDKPDAPYSIKQMADDTAGLMDALGITRAALLGISMGGMIAQEFALHHQEKLSCLILGCTHFGGADIVPTPPEISPRLWRDPARRPRNRSRCYRRSSATTPSNTIPRSSRKTLASARSMRFRRSRWRVRSRRPAPSMRARVSARFTFPPWS